MQLPFGLDPVSFFVGAGLVLVLAFAAFLINIWWFNATSPFRPQIAAQTTRKTPWQVVVNAFGAMFQYVGLALVVAALVLVVIFRYSLQSVGALALVGVIALGLGTLMRAISK